jgi:RNA methyltransferase, TrmH family
MGEFIESLQNPLLKRVRSLADKKYRAAEGLFIAEGEGQLIRARENGWEAEILISTSDWMTDTGLIRWAEKHVIVPVPVMPRITGMDNAPPVMAAIKPRFAQLHPQGLWLALEDIRDPGNLGTILRTAEAAGAAGVVLIGETCDPFSRECVRAATGSLFAMPIVRMDKAQALEAIHSWPGDVVGTQMQASESYKAALKSPTILLMGSESKGLSPELLQAATKLVAIPMASSVESLNVAIASALMLYAAKGL